MKEKRQENKKKKNDEYILHLNYIVIVSIVRKCFRTLTLPRINTL